MLRYFLTAFYLSLLKQGRLTKIKRKSAHTQQYHLKTVIPIVIIVIFIFTGYVISIVTESDYSISIEKYDSIKIDYTVWESDERRTYNVLNPLVDTVLWVTLIPITENDTTGLILGLYNNLIGKELSYQSRLMWLDRCIDEDRDGIDDITGDPALSYGNFSDLYYNTSLMIQFKVLGIQKADDSQQFPNINTEVRTVIRIITIVIIAVVSLVLVVLLIKNYVVNKRLKPESIPKTRYSRKEKILKYGLLITLWASIVLINLGIFNMTFPLSDITLLSEYFPFAFPLVIALIILLCICVTPFYLLAFGIIKRRKME